MNFCLSHFIAIVLAGVVVVIFYYYLDMYPVSEYVFGDRFVIVDNANNPMLKNEETYKKIQELYENGLISTPAELFTALTSFYDTVIIVLIVIITVFGALAYFSVRALSHRTAVEMAKSSAKDGVSDYMASKEFYDIVKSEIKEQTSELTESTGKALELMDQMENVIKRGEEVISKTDNSEEIEDDEVVLDEEQN